MYCPKCGHSVPDNAEFCPECGTRIKRKANTEQQKQFRFCPNCGQKISENTAFCPKCGAKIGRNIAERTERTGSGTFDNYRAKKLQKRSKKWFTCIIAIALIVCLVISFVVRGLNNGYQKGVENFVEATNTICSMQEKDSIDIEDIRKLAKLVLPKTIVDESVEVIEMVSSIEASRENKTQGEILTDFFSGDTDLKNGSVKLKKIESATKLQKIKLDEYQKQIRNSNLSVLLTRWLEGISISGVNASEIAQMLNVSEADAEKLYDNLQNISMKIKKMKVTDGYRIKMETLAVGDKATFSTNFIYVDGTWVWADFFPDMLSDLGE